MTFLESLIYGFISGFSEFSPISSHAHQRIILYMLGKDVRISILDLLIHFGMLIAVFVCGRTLLTRIHRERVIAGRSRRRHAAQSSISTTYDLRIVRTAFFPMIIGLLCYIFTKRMEDSLVYISAFMILNGLILFFTNHVRQGNKDGRSFSALDSIGMGVLGALGAVPGLSRIGTTCSFSIYRGVDKASAYNWALLLSIPAIVLYMGFDVFGMGSAVLSGIGIISAVGSIIASFLGSCAAISLMRYLMVNIGLAGFSYYCWGAAALNFIIYLLT